MVELGTAIRIIRQAREMKQGELARAAGISTPFLCLVESGGRQPSLGILRAIAEALDVPPEVLVLLATPVAGGLRTDDERASALANSIRSLVEAENALRARLAREGTTGASK